MSIAESHDDLLGTSFSGPGKLMRAADVREFDPLPNFVGAKKKSIINACGPATGLDGDPDTRLPSSGHSSHFARFHRFLV